MSRSVRDTAMETRTARLRLAVRKEPYWKGLDAGLALGVTAATRAAACGLHDGGMARPTAIASIALAWLTMDRMRTAGRFCRFAMPKRRHERGGSAKKDARTV